MIQNVRIEYQVIFYSFIHFLQAAQKKNILVAICSQCPLGNVNLDLYETGTALQNLGCITTKDMTIETVATKLSYLFGSYDDLETIKRLMNKSIRGELTENLELLQ